MWEASGRNKKKSNYIWGKKLIITTDITDILTKISKKESWNNELTTYTRKRATDSDSLKFNK